MPLTDEQIREIFLSDEGTTELARRYGTHPATVSRIRSRRERRYMRVLAEFPVARPLQRRISPLTGVGNWEWGTSASYWGQR